MPVCPHCEGKKSFRRDGAVCSTCKGLGYMSESALLVLQVQEVRAIKKKLLKAEQDSLFAIEQERVRTQDALIKSKAEDEKWKITRVYISISLVSAGVMALIAGALIGTRLDLPSIIFAGIFICLLLLTSAAMGWSEGTYF